MGKDLFMSFPSARQVFEEADESLGTKLSSLIFDGQQKDLTLTQNAQPAILTTSIAALKILERRRGESMAKTVSQLGVKTAMAALVVREENLPKLRGAIEEVCSTLPEGEFVELANLNSAVISGTSQAVDQASRFLQSKRLAARAVDLPVSAPFHCKLMQPAAEMMKEALNGIKFQKPIVDVISNVTATEEIPLLLFKQVTSTVQWQRSIKYCRGKGLDNFILFGPARVLANLLKKDFPLDRIRPFTTVKDIELFADCIKLKHANTL
ncbi:6484_t:CDS:2 [Diversispora eburnea]|uniref:[acyl-carrier-protein] S-malonyltransferase n=1 Tax=Diversispora eburnea TaxID=1213867 RepID=A0A9N8YQ43_9GLOM|nr:6484_t:CDS:2 [Diversispora eburnea]